jgi:hypothetical protein
MSASSGFRESGAMRSSMGVHVSIHSLVFHSTVIVVPAPGPNFASPAMSYMFFERSSPEMLRFQGRDVQHQNLDCRFCSWLETP